MIHQIFWASSVLSVEMLLPLYNYVVVLEDAQDVPQDILVLRLILPNI